MAVLERMLQETMPDLLGWETEEQRACYERIYDVVLDHAPCEILVTAPDYTVLTANREVERLTGIKRREILGKRCYEVLGAGEPCAGCPVSQTLATKKIHRNRKKQRSDKGKPIYIEHIAVPVLDEAGEIAWVVEMARDITSAIKLDQKNKRMFLEVVTAMAKLIDSRDQWTGEHSVRTRDIAVAIGRKLKLGQEVLEEIAVAALLHDIGKIGVPEDILKKPGKLTATEFHIIQKHPQIGYDALSGIQPLRRVAEYILYHHENYDGQGYPAHKRGAEIPLVSRILCVADVYEALTADRVYRSAMAVEKALRIMAEERGTKFDPVVFDAFLKVVHKDRNARSALSQAI